MQKWPLLLAWWFLRLPDTCFCSMLLSTSAAIPPQCHTLICAGQRSLMPTSMLQGAA